MRRLSIYPSYILTNQNVHCPRPILFNCSKIPSSLPSFLLRGSKSGRQRCSVNNVRDPCLIKLRCFRLTMVSDDMCLYVKGIGWCWWMACWGIKNRKNRNVEKNVIIAQRFASKKWWRSTCLASGLALIWHSRPLSVLSIAGRLQRGATHCAR